jgi:glycosyltransferase involved in cell wall biosynthesis
MNTAVMLQNADHSIAVHQRRLLICCPNFEIGGFSSHAMIFGRAFRSFGYHVGALVVEPFGELCPDFVTAFDEVTILRRGVETRRAYLRRLLGVFRQLHPDIVINSRVSSVQAVLPLLPVAVTKISVVHCVGVEVNTGLANAGSLDAVVAVSENVRAELVRQKLDDVRIVTIPVAVEVNMTEAPHAAPSTPLRIIFVGRLAGQKNLPGLIRIAELLRERATPFVLTVVGGGEEMKALRSAIRRAGLTDQVEVLGSRRPREIASLLNQHDFFLMTSHVEGTPHTVLEAMSHGLVVLASRIPGATDHIITHGVDGFLCDPSNPAEYVDTLLRVYGDAGCFASISCAARRTTSRRFSSRRLAMEYQALFRLEAGFLWDRGDTTTAQCRIPVALASECVGLARQIKHRCADIWRWLAHGKRLVKPPQ